MRVGPTVVVLVVRELLEASVVVEPVSDRVSVFRVSVGPSVPPPATDAAGREPAVPLPVFYSEPLEAAPSAADLSARAARPRPRW